MLSSSVRALKDPNRAYFWIFMTLSKVNIILSVIGIWVTELLLHVSVVHFIEIQLNKMSYSAELRSVLRDFGLR